MPKNVQSLNLLPNDETILYSNSVLLFATIIHYGQLLHLYLISAAATAMGSSTQPAIRSTIESKRLGILA